MFSCFGLLMWAYCLLAGNIIMCYELTSWCFLIAQCLLLFQSVVTSLHLERSFVTASLTWAYTTAHWRKVGWPWLESSIPTGHAFRRTGVTLRGRLDQNRSLACWLPLYPTYHKRYSCSGWIPPALFRSEYEFSSHTQTSCHDTFPNMRMVSLLPSAFASLIDRPPSY